jgi:acetyl-CoA carboxylase biotin carboxyl carrier protein
MFKFDEICELIRLVGSTRVASVEIEHAGSRLSIKGLKVVSKQGAGPATAVGETTMDPPQSAAFSGGTTQAVGAAAQTAVEENLHVVTSPIVGTFYRAPNPDADPYVEVGDTVRKGQVLCIVEAMKLMNEIESDVVGTIAKIFPENAEPVEYGQPLFAVRPV